MPYNNKVFNTDMKFSDLDFQPHPVWEDGVQAKHFFDKTKNRLIMFCPIFKNFDVNMVVGILVLSAYVLGALHVLILKKIYE
jgi:hypothetical protein